MTNEPTRIDRRRLLRDSGLLGLTIAGSGALGTAAARAGTLAATSGSAARAATVLTPEEEEGPFYVAIEKIRKDITLGRPGVPLTLNVKVVNATTGKPIEAAALDIWQCDATGVYSDESSESTIGQTWLRGVQLTDANGHAQFRTIYPGHYNGRATHIHVKVHIAGKVSATGYSGGHVSHTGQLFFDDALSERVYALAPYAGNRNTLTTHAQDHVWTQQHGAETLLALKHAGASLAAGVVGSITLGVNPGSTPAKVGM